MKLPSLKIGDLNVWPPIIQGGMGVRVSRASLAAAVANQGGVGIIAAVGLGRFETAPGSKFVEVNEMALREEIRKARRLSNGIIGVNAMMVLSNFENLVKTAVDEKVDVIISGAGLPLGLPGLTKGTNIKLIPIVSSARALSVICRKWQRDFNKLPDAVVVEGPKAGGHLGFGHEDITENRASSLDVILGDVLTVARSFSPAIPVIAAGGVFDGADIAHFLRLGASGVQMASRFVCTVECDVDEKFKQAYINAREEDIVIIHSPVGLPGRVIRNAFVEKIQRKETTPFICSFHCLRTCNPRTAPFCIAKVLANASDGNLEEGFVFAGANAHRCTEIVPVKTLMEELVKEAEHHLDLIPPAASLGPQAA